MADDFKAQAEKNMSALENWLAPLFAKAPHIPKSGRDVLTGIAPWLALIGGVVGIMGILSYYSLSMVAGPFSYLSMGGTMYPGSMISMIFLGIGAVLELLAFKPLLARKKKGWNFLFYSVVAMTVYMVLEMFIGYGNIMNIIGIVISFWLLFEVRDSYHA